MAATIIDSGRRVFTNLKSILFTPYTDESTLGETTYDLVNIVGDTTSVEQADNDVQTIEHEFSSSPLYESVTLGDKTFTCECIDFQNDVLKNLFGWDTEEGGDAFAPLDYKDLYCKVEMQFNSTKDIVVLPKLKMNSKAVLSSLKTDASRGTISGTCYPAYVKAGEKEYKTDMAIIGSANASRYSVSTTPTVVS